MASYSASWTQVENECGGRPVLDGTVDEMRIQFHGLLDNLLVQYPENKPEVLVDGGVVDGVKYCVYTPKRRSSQDTVAVHFHGGGLVLGDLYSEDKLCSQLADRTGLVLVTVDYRLAPEHKAPAQVDDCLKLTEWAAENGATLLGRKGEDFTTKVLLVGVSAGGGLALSVTRRIVKGESSALSADRLAGVVALAPVTLHPDNVPAAALEASGVSGYTSYTEFATDAAIVNRKTMNTFFDAAKAATDSEDAFPALDTALYTSSHYTYPPAYIAICENDPIRDDGKVVAGLLETGGRRVKSKIYNGLPHCFWIFPTILERDDFIDDTVSAISWLLEA
ncbi:hypothetical protein SEUCBS139899_008985 [Sporothrix eucalyptigena]|uniref:Alpha/beta hydrolase fold-3 domain-containing protein n=1 Tax=Sporothrix eucalyptigena TaxID=1812306 RepID=A0ABP0AMZ0_9PEZI